MIVFSSQFVCLVIPSHGFPWFSFIAFTPILKVLICLPTQSLNSLGAGSMFYSFLYAKEKISLDRVKQARKTLFNTVAIVERDFTQLH